jgi:hypothetical protein
MAATQKAEVKSFNEPEEFRSEGKMVTERRLAIAKRDSCAADDMLS